MLVAADGAVTVLAADHADLLLGWDPGTTRAESDVLLTRGATLLMYTDGLVERRGEDIDIGIDRLLASASAVAGQPLEKLVDSVLADLCPEAPVDDVVLRALRRRPYSEPPSSRDTES